VRGLHFGGVLKKVGGGGVLPFRGIASLVILSFHFCTEQKRTSEKSNEFVGKEKVAQE